MSTSNTLGNAARSAYDAAFQTSPIIMSGGLFSSALGGLMTLSSLASSVINSVTGSDVLPTVRYVPLPGATVINNTVATYPFANRNVAGNAVIRNPKNVSLMMIAPVNSVGGYLLKMATFMALQSTFEAHTAAGGTFHVLTPSYPFFDCLMTTMTDVTSGEGHQQQIMWQIDFVQPLVTQQQAQQAYNGMMSAIAGGKQLTTSSWSGAASAAGSLVQGVTSLGSNIGQFLTNLAPGTSFAYNPYK
jgi:hypothetical protein